MKSSLLAVGLLFFATGAQAQHSHSPLMAGGNSGGSGYSGGGGWGSGGDWGSSPLGSSSYGSSSSFGSRGRAIRYEARRDFSVGSVQNDGDFVPSTFMNYDEALRLGQQQLAAEAKAAQGDSSPSLGEVARAYRIVKVPTLRLQSLVRQDNAGRLQVCNLNGNDCHRP
jgi:hypothetical protein